MSADAAERGQSDTELRRLIGLPFDDPDDVVRAAVEEASVPALLMSMVHMTGDVGLLDELPGPYALIAMDLQGAMSEDDKNRVRRRAFEVIVDYRDRGCPPPFVPDDTDLSRMLAVVSAGTVPDEFLDYVAADLRFTPDDQPVAEPVSTPRQRAAFPVVVIGAGESGILAGIRLRQAGIPFTIIDRNDGVGGTWQTNRYPGCRVDIPGQYYTYSFEPADHWAHHHATQPEILAYLCEVADRYDVTSHVRTGTEVIAADWDTTHSVCHVRVRTADGVHENLDARALICAVGQFSNATIPDVPGAESFPGPAFHTADWHDDVHLDGLRVAVIGAGASGFQLVPAIAGLAAHVDVYQRTPQWMAPNVDHHAPVGGGARWAIRHLPYYGRWLRFISWWPIADGARAATIIDPEWDAGGVSVSAANHQIREMFIAWMRAFTTDEGLLAKVTPRYPPMGKRTLQDDGTWLTTLQRDDVDLITEPIREISGDAVITRDGTRRRADVLVWATGFDVNHQLGGLSVRGRDGIDLAEAWGDDPYARKQSEAARRDGLHLRGCVELLPELAWQRTVTARCAHRRPLALDQTRRSRRLRPVRPHHRMTRERR